MLADLEGALPRFARVRLTHDDALNEYLDLVLREPTDDDDRRVPVATVSRRYALIQHQDAVAWVPGLRIMCFSGRGGEVLAADGSWRRISRDDVKRRFREGSADVLLCTDAAAEGLNFQFCGALVNFDMPWNPMRVEQRIGRIDRLGQRYPDIRIINLHYSDTVEAYPSGEGRLPRFS